MTTAKGTYATPAAVKARLDQASTWTTAETALLTTLCDQLNAWIEGECGRALCPLPDTEILLDGVAADDGGRVLRVPFGLNSLTSLEIAPQTGAAFLAVPAGDFLLRPSSLMRKPGWPATAVLLTDMPSSANATGNRFWPGFGNIRLRGSAGFAGWPAIPDEVAELAVTAVVRAWAGRGAGQSDQVGSDEFGRPMVSRYLSRRDRDTLERYSARSRTAG